ncbi:MAG: hypothetical protein M1438_18575 [Deltaproteobacteria bacterium]|nr:hypothetical protein [Deltaproteobacteria bacterium]
MATRRLPGKAEPDGLWMADLAARYPYLQRHPHPAMAHFPIVFMLSASFFTLLYLLTGVASFETTAFHCLGGGMLTTPGAIITGVFTQRLNYPHPEPTLAQERRLSYLLWAMVTAAFVWRWLDPLVLRDLQGWNFVYLLLVLALTPLVTVISFHGGMITFPLEENSADGAAVRPFTIVGAGLKPAPTPREKIG